MNYEYEIIKLISNKRLIKQLIKYIKGSTISTPEKDNIVRVLRRMRIGDKLDFKEIIRKSREENVSVKLVLYLEPETYDNIRHKARETKVSPEEYIINITESVFNPNRK